MPGARCYNETPRLLTLFGFLHDLYEATSLKPATHVTESRSDIVDFSCLQ